MHYIWKRKLTRAFFLCIIQQKSCNLQEGFAMYVFTLVEGLKFYMLYHIFKPSMFDGFGENVCLLKIYGHKNYFNAASCDLFSNCELK